jgi:hypothetical protein
MVAVVLVLARTGTEQRHPAPPSHCLQVLWSTFVGTPTMLPSLCTLGLGCAVLALGLAGKLPPAVESAWGGLSAWSATMLFMLQPVAQLHRNFSVSLMRCWPTWRDGRACASLSAPQAH